MGKERNQWTGKTNRQMVERRSDGSEAPPEDEQKSDTRTVDHDATDPAAQPATGLISSPDALKMTRGSGGQSPLTSPPPPLRSSVRHLCVVSLCHCVCVCVCVFL